MQRRLSFLVMCLLLALAIPAWGANGKTAGKKGSAKKTTVVKTPAVPKATVSPSGYVRDPSKPMAMRQYLKELKQKQKAAAENAAAKAGKADTPQTEGGAK